ncbi:MFS general substrate transporter [Fistulina hepatica ATCC 64428]|uniref:MFS general substrate transporter n=1 Tax=Fistulina hepatica ATCC 64428 TaxID=1128425 RepID=A0A0D7ABD5_9AGAR|nr:MFS general substrate transporter [Fistulina hepatica ATCC 64428]
MASTDASPLVLHAQALSPSHAESPPASASSNNLEKQTSTGYEDASHFGFQDVYKRHGRIDLIPLPSDDPLDPLNWSSARKHILLSLVAFHACFGPFSAASISEPLMKSPCSQLLAIDFGCSITEASYFVSVPIIFLGAAPLFWGPVAARIGAKRPIYLMSVLISAALHLALAYCKTYGSFMALRALQAIFICPPQSIGASTISDMFFQHEKGQKMGIWALLVSVGPMCGPLIMGPLLYHTGRWQWTFYLLAIVNLAHFVLYIFFCPETTFDRPERTAVHVEYMTPAPGKWYTPYVQFKRHSPAPWSRLPLEIIAPLKYIYRPTVFLPSLAYAIPFTYTNVLLTVQVPALLGQKYDLNEQQIGLQFLAPLIGAMLGEPIAGYGSDKWMEYRVRKAGGRREPEWRLPCALPGFVIAIVGLMIFGVQLQNTTAGVWNVTPDIGSAISLFGVQLLTTVCVTYAIESQPTHPLAAAALVALIRQTYAFAGPFYFTKQFDVMGAINGMMLSPLGSHCIHSLRLAACGLLAGLIAFGMCLILVTMALGKSWRANENRADSFEDSSAID